MSRAGPKAMGELLSELMARHGYARVQSSVELETVWREAVGELAANYTRPGRLKRGVLEVWVANSVLIQELGFRKQEILKLLTDLLPEQKITDLRFRLGTF